MTTPTIFETCRPREDVLQGKVAEADFAADLAQVMVGEGAQNYTNPDQFFANTYPTRGLKNLLANVCSRLSGRGSEVASIFRLDTSYGGGKSHGLIALCHVARSGSEIFGIEEFVDPELMPRQSVRIAAFDGENADPTNGRRMLEGHLAFTPWGEIAFALAGVEGYERVRKSDENRVAPGAETLRELFGGQPTLILLDELSVYLRKVSKDINAREQLTAFLTSLFKAVESTNNAALVFTLAIGKDGIAKDAYSDENQFIADQMAEAESVSARKATLLNPTEEDETIQVVRRRLFESIDETAAVAVGKSYRTLWESQKDSLPEIATRPESSEAFRLSYPLHPEVLETLTSKTATLGKFQRVRGMLRLLAHTVGQLWAEQPTDATAIHLHHIDLGYEPVRQELVTRLEQSRFVPAISNDVSAGQVDKTALAQEIDKDNHQGLPPYASYVARTIFMHTLAFNEPLKGVSPEQLRYSILGPLTDISFIEEARKKFIVESAYLDDRPGAPMSFLAEANLTQMIRRTEEHVDAGEVRAELNDRIREIFRGKTLDVVAFPGGPFDVTDDIADGRPKLVVIGYDALAISTAVNSVPELVGKIYEKKGSTGSETRLLRNHLIFVVADEELKKTMQRKTYRKLALREMVKPDRLTELADYQQFQLRELEAKSEQELALTIQQCYRHVFYPSRNHIGTSNVDLAHTTLDIYSTSDKPGMGQQQVVRVLRDLNKLRLSEDEPDSPSYVRDRTPLKKGHISVFSLRNEFRRDPALPMLVGDDIFVRGVRRGIQQREYVYQRDKLLCGPGEPDVTIEIDEQSMILTMSYAKNKGIWPRQALPENGDNGSQEEGETDGGGDGGEDPTEKESFTAEGILREALVQVWEQVRAKKVKIIRTLNVRMFEPKEALRFINTVQSVSGAGRKVTVIGGYKTRAGGCLRLEFQGAVEDAQPLQEFLISQLREADSVDFDVGFELSFKDGLLMDSDRVEELTKHLCRFAEDSAAYVKAEQDN